MTPFAPTCPVEERERVWIQDSMDWFRGQFGDDPLQRPVVLPTSEFFPPPFSGSDADVRAAVHRVCGYMGLGPERIRVALTDDYDHAAALRRFVPRAVAQVDGAAGTYHDDGGGDTVTIDRSAVGDPARLLAVIAHELGHVRLLGEHRVAADRKDGEPLTDLVTVYLGMGIFTANAAFDFHGLPRDRPAMRIGGWSTSRLGYMTEQMFGYGLACLAWLRDEPDPPWAKFLDTNPRDYLKHGLRYLRHQSPPGGAFPPPDQIQRGS
jgi:hypothetical protein